MLDIFYVVGSSRDVLVGHESSETVDLTSLMKYRRNLTNPAQHVTEKGAQEDRLSV